MHISKLTLVNYRNFSKAALSFTKGVNTIIGENGSGKTNLFRAIRLLLDDNMVRAAHKLDEGDFHRGLDNWRGHWIILSIVFEEIGPEESIQSLFLHGAGVIDGEVIERACYSLIFRPKKDVRLRFASLEAGDFAGLAAIRASITVDDYEAIFTGRADADFGDEEVYKELVGDFENCVFSDEVEDPRIGSRVPVYLSLTKEVSFTHIQALRDVVAEFHNNRTNPLLNLLKRKSGEVAGASLAPIVAQVSALNSAIEALDDVQTVRSNIRDTIKDAAGETYSPSALSIKSDLPDEPDKLFQSLRLFVGETSEGYEGAIHELSLGGANLIFLTLKLLEFKYQKANESIANFLLIEEPEAHIHTHIQKTLFDRIAYDDTQIIYSTHSTQISEVSNVGSMNVLGRNGVVCEAMQPAKGLSGEESKAIQRYLDAVRCNLLFAKSVVLVEGDAEEILIPLLFKKVIGLSLDELGISLINIRSTGFENVAILFNEARLKRRCSIVTDLDAVFMDVTLDASDSDATANFKKKCIASAAAGDARKIKLDAFVDGNRWTEVHYADHTFEVDFVAAGNARSVVDVVPLVYTQNSTRAAATADLESGDIARFGRRVLTMATQEGKGWFAILLGGHIDHNTIIPAYIVKAIFFARESLSPELFFHIYKYRVRCSFGCGGIDRETADMAYAILDDFRRGAVALDELREAMVRTLAGDQIHGILADVR